MVYTRTAIEHRGDIARSLLPPIASDLRLVTSADQRARFAAERALDQVLADSFPASDPPSWTLGVAPPASSGYAESGASTDERAMENKTGEPAKRTFLQGLVSLAGAAGIALLVPFAILLIGLPIVVVVRGVAEAIGWLLAWSAG